MVFFLFPLLVQLVIGIAFQAIGYLLMPKPKEDKPTEVQDMDDPTAEAGRPIPVVFGEMEVTGINVLWFGDKATITKKIDV
ncbi:hypothetical protein [Manganibacter manganicus]|uniref:Uncharacterized protein n=1 Tax=Manganibacter manganicus TaxID=1873176 RepID=A0A1V8RQY1_9HYPH|nr:hypothetical protein [Pseudaminobacter manganicus]OQM75606.1 hypothetical protein BFN67_17695 [Pseudaminobacter manganicus]